MSTMQNRSYKTVKRALTAVAAELGISFDAARNAYYTPDKYSEGTHNSVVKAMQKMGYAIEKRLISRPYPSFLKMKEIPEGARATTLQEVAEILGIGASTVRKCFAAPNPNSRVHPDTKKAILEACKKLGYIHPRSVAGKQRTQERLNAVRQAHFWKGGNFHSKEEEVARMRQLREEGYSNMEIAKKIGRSYQTVRKSIGTQPTDMTLHTKAMSGAARTKKTQERKVYVADHTIRAYNNTLQEINTLRNDAKALLEKADSLEKTLKDTLPDVKKAQKVATLPLLTIEPAINLASAQPTTIQ